MRRFSMAFLAFMAANTINAAIITLSNDPQRPGMFNNWNSAQSAASPNDTILIYNSVTHYNGGMSVTKPLTIIGNGHNPAILNSQTIKSGGFSFGAGSGGSKVMGFFINESQITVNPGGIGVIQIENCIIKGPTNQFPALSISSGRVIMRNCIISRGGSSTSQGILNNYVMVIHINSPGPHYFQNNVIISSFTATTTAGRAFFSATFQQGGGNWNSFNNTIFENNIFIATQPETRLFALSFTQAANNNSFFNNVFYDVESVASSQSCQYCVFTNNIVHNCVSCSLIGGTQTGGDNLFAEPIFENYEGGTFNHATHDLRMVEGSPGIGAGLGGVDIGVFGGQYSMIPGTFHNQLSTVLPYITSFNVTNPIIPEETGGPLEVQSAATIFNE